MRRYNPNVRIGNWYDELILAEEKAKQYSRKSKNLELKVQRARQLFLDLLKEIPLTVPVLGLCYGASIQIVGWHIVTSRLYWLLRRVKKLERLTRFDEDIPVSPFIIAKGIVSGQTQTDDAFICYERRNRDVFIESAVDEPQRAMYQIPEGHGLALTGHIPWDQIDYRTTFAKGDSIIASGLITPCVRNVWTLIPQDKSKKGKEVRFGDSFYIQLFGSEKKFYIEAVTRFPFAPNGECGHVVPKLATFKSTETRFKIEHPNPYKRYEYEGQVVKPFEKVSFILGSTNEALAAETDFWFPTYFGMECEVSIFNYHTDDRPVQPSTKNFWSCVLSP